MIRKNISKKNWDHLSRSGVLSYNKSLVNSSLKHPHSISFVNDEFGICMYKSVYYGKIFDCYSKSDNMKSSKPR